MSDASTKPASDDASASHVAAATLTEVLAAAMELVEELGQLVGEDDVGSHVKQIAEIVGKSHQMASDVESEIAGAYDDNDGDSAEPASKSPSKPLSAVRRALASRKSPAV